MIRGRAAGAAAREGDQQRQEQRARAASIDFEHHAATEEEKMEPNSLELFKDWSNALLVTTVAALGWVATKDLVFRPAWTRSLCILFFSLSVVFAIFTLALIPLIAEQQDVEPSIYNVAITSDLLDQINSVLDYVCILSLLDRIGISIRSLFLRNVCFPQHAFFLMGIGLYAVGTWSTRNTTKVEYVPAPTND
jgi:hypothetical protein